IRLRQRLVAELPLRCHHLRQHGEHAVGVERDRLDALAYQPLRDLGIIGGRLAADADVLAACLAGLDGHLHEFQHGAVAFVEAGDDDGVTVHAEGALGEVVGADRETVEQVEELVGEQGVGGYFAHHENFQILFAAAQTVLRHQIQNLPRLVHAAHEGDHQRDIAQAHRFTHLFHRRAFHRKAFGEARGRITRGAAEADHGILFLGLVRLAAEQRRVFVGRAGAHAHDHRRGVERRGDGADALGEAVDIKRARIGITGDQRGNLLAPRGRELRIVDERVRMDANAVVDYEFLPREADAGGGQLANLEGGLRIADVDHDAGVGPGQRGEIRRVFAKAQRAGIDVARVALRAGYGDGSTRSDALSGGAAADNGGDAELARDDGGVTGAAAAGGDDGRGNLHHRLPVGVGDVGDQHLAGFEFPHVFGFEYHARGAGGDLLAHALASGEQRTARFETVSFERMRSGFGGVHGLGPCLLNEEFIALAVFRPFDVHGHGAAGLLGIMPLDHHRVARELQHLVVVERETFTLFFFHRDIAGGNAGLGVGGVDEFAFLAAELAFEYRPMVRGERGLEHVDLVGVDAVLFFVFV